MISKFQNLKVGAGLEGFSCFHKHLFLGVNTWFTIAICDFGFATPAKPAL
jgi:hypothetical protein